MTTTFACNLAGEVLSESYSGGSLSGLSLTNGYDTLMRRTNLTALNSTTPLVKDAFGYDHASRLLSATDNSAATAYSANYSYLANSPLVSQIVFQQGASARMTTSKTYDFLNRLTQITSAPTGASNVSFTYSYNNANQRVVCRLADGSYWRYQYDSLGQVTSGHKYFSDGTPVPERNGVTSQQMTLGLDVSGFRCFDGLWHEPCASNGPAEDITSPPAATSARPSSEATRTGSTFWNCWPSWGSAWGFGSTRTC